LIIDGGSYLTANKVNIPSGKERLSMQRARVKRHDPTQVEIIATFTQQAIKNSVTLADLLRRPGFHYVDLDRYRSPNLDQAERRLKLTSNILAISSASRIVNQIARPGTSSSYRQDLDYSAIRTKKRGEKACQKVEAANNWSSCAGGGISGDVNAFASLFGVRVPLPN